MAKVAIQNIYPIGKFLPCSKSEQKIVFIFMGYAHTEYRNSTVHENTPVQF